MPSPYYPRSIRGLTLFCAVLSAGVTILLGAVTMGVVHHEMERQIDQRIETETQALLVYQKTHGFEALIPIVNLRDQRGKPGSHSYLASADNVHQPGIGYYLADTDGRKIAGNLSGPLPPIGWSADIPWDSSSDKRAHALRTLLPDGQSLLVTADTSSMYRMDFLLMRLFGISLLIVLIWGGLIVLFFARIMKARLMAMESSAMSIMQGDMSRRMPRDGSDVEFDRLASLLNQMLDHIGHLVENLRTISSGLAHDLRTPLARLRGTLETLAQQPHTAENQAMLDRALRESDDLMGLFTGLLSISEIDSPHIRAKFNPLDLANIVRNMGEAYAPALEDKGITLQMDLAPAPILGNAKLLSQMLANLLDNVLNHATGCTQVSVALAVQADQAVLSIEDDGEGVPMQDLERIFDRMTRLDHSRHTPGHGLGLSLVRAIAQAHHGTAAGSPVSEDGPTTGLKIEIRLPIHNFC